MVDYDFGTSGPVNGRQTSPVSNTPMLYIFVLIISTFGAKKKEKNYGKQKSTDWVSHISFFLWIKTELHEGAITSVQFHPTDSTKVLTNGMDSCLKIVDIRTCMAVHVLKHADFQTSYGWSSSCFSPDGTYWLVLYFSTTNAERRRVVS